MCQGFTRKHVVSFGSLSFLSITAETDMFITAQSAVALLAKINQIDILSIHLHKALLGFRINLLVKAIFRFSTQVDALDS
jgi:hypothetical protein